jgi:ribosome-associated heat shock protein Hsp15
LPKSRVGAKLAPLYVLDQTPAVELEKIRTLHSNFSPLRDAGSGRPTKKDRRDLDGFLIEDEIIDFDEEN